MAHQQHQRWSLSRFWPPGGHEAVEEDTVEDDGKPDCETSYKIGDNDNGNG